MGFKLRIKKPKIKMRDLNPIRAMKNILDEGTRVGGNVTDTFKKAANDIKAESHKFGNDFAGGFQSGINVLKSGYFESNKEQRKRLDEKAYKAEVNELGAERTNLLNAVTSDSTISAATRADLLQELNTFNPQKTDRNLFNQIKTNYDMAKQGLTAKERARKKTEEMFNLTRDLPGARGTITDSVARARNNLFGGAG